MLKISNLSFAYGDNKVIDNLSLDFAQEGTYFIVGKSGLGKTTLIDLIAGLIKPQSGAIQFWKDKPKITFLFQEDRLLNWISSRKNIEISRDINCKITSDEWLKIMQLDDCGDKLPTQLSGGMCRRVALARALAHNGEVLIMDEPFRGLDNETKMRIYDIFIKYNKAKLTIIITHEEEDIQNIPHIGIYKLEK